MTGRIDLLARTRDSPAAVDRFDARHHSREIPSNRQVATCEFLQSSQAMHAVINRVELVQVQQFGQFARIDAVILIPVFQQRILARIADHHTCNVRLEQIV